MVWKWEEAVMITLTGIIEQSSRHHIASTACMLKVGRMLDVNDDTS
jgi:hypothetical protein